MTKIEKDQLHWVIFYLGQAEDTITDVYFEQKVKDNSLMDISNDILQIIAKIDKNYFKKHNKSNQMDSKNFIIDYQIPEQPGRLRRQETATTKDVAIQKAKTNIAEEFDVRLHQIKILSIY